MSARTITDVHILAGVLAVVFALARLLMPRVENPFSVPFWTALRTKRALRLVPWAVLFVVQMGAATCLPLTYAVNWWLKSEVNVRLDFTQYQTVWVVLYAGLIALIVGLQGPLTQAVANLLGYWEIIIQPTFSLAFLDYFRNRFRSDYLQVQTAIAQDRQLQVAQWLHRNHQEKQFNRVYESEKERIALKLQLIPPLFARDQEDKVMYYSMYVGYEDTQRRLETAAVSTNVASWDGKERRKRTPRRAELDAMLRLFGPHSRARIA